MVPRGSGQGCGKGKEHGRTNGSEKARQEISSNAHEALETYTQLRGLSNELNSRNEKAWGSMIHLTEYVEATTRQLWEEMEQILSV